MEQPDSSTWDQAHDVPIMSWRSSDLPDHLPEHPVHLVKEPEEPGGLHLRSLYEPSDSTTLIVSLHGALPRGKFKLPRFEWRRTLNRVECARLYLSDSTLEISGSLEIGWYIGTAQQDLHSEYAAFVRSLAAAEGYQHILLVGSSAGGFGALALSRQLADSLAVVFSPQTTISGYQPGHRRALAGASFPDHTTFDAIEADFADRVNMRSLYSQSLDNNFVHYVQNTRDRFHFEAHYAAFALSFGVNPEVGGSARGRRMSFHPERQEEGHAPPSRSQFIRHIEDAYRRYFDADLSVLPPEAVQGANLGNR
ncbi:hypothetical protein PTW37_09600 [Arthrobacter agilis]|uniref:hypothetical protein n=1 Tax=Arthrobacter agilis TaxID=37921 RepID=UPI0023651A13|nr:hypothetical protein [Arthrobacter agilis]WDF32134.1 hypothetical protein PTW37_09600 [Arthrobacter agilis]